MAHPFRRTSDRRQAHSPPDPEMAEGGRSRRRGRDDERQGHGAGVGDIAAAGQRLPVLRVRSLGQPLAQAGGHGRNDHREVCRRHHRRFPARGGRPALLGRDARTVEGVCAIAASGQDPADRVWPLCGGQPEAAWARQAGNLRIPGLHLHQRQIARRQIPDSQDEPTRPRVGEARGDQEALRRRMHQSIPAQGKWLAQVVGGWFNYHAVPTNSRALAAFRYHVTDLWRCTLRRRSDKDRRPGRG